MTTNWLNPDEYKALYKIFKDRLLWFEKREKEKWTVKKIVDYFSISRSTFYRWYSRFKKARKEVALSSKVLKKKIIKEKKSENKLNKKEDKAVLMKESKDKLKAFGEVLKRHYIDSVSSYSSPAFTDINKSKENYEKKLREIKNEIKEEQYFSSHYNTNYIVLMVRDPYYTFAYWELVDSYLKDFVSSLKDKKVNNYNLVMRVYYSKTLNSLALGDSFDIDIKGMLYGSWYIKVYPSTYYKIVLGLRHKEDWTWFPLIESNTVKTPNNTISEIEDLYWDIDFDYDKINDRTSFTFIPSEGEGQISSLYSLAKEEYEKLIQKYNFSSFSLPSSEFLSSPSYLKKRSDK